ncbi:NAD-dependent epimerase/dehydratase family protein [Leptospira borgpetersenii]|uniref:NAD-dependent epimerase/dehydratase family protein n=2 Tax=Leptospira borgpetersenii TaxID=174 RepID=UPI0007734C78|nr:SDR family oxidoreductase [Leptospira borgpetersenii]MBE8398968.1 SDR family oxidoreductase [Leptospira borgpetersenii serovar Tarassovi]MBE8402073.1 SDR family oxidoreductase [Leptospira borgpetersenii serovar Tarassovi]MBE8406337.1 SDR family oxidoreductase [Leptospira borgpetersenii serovar Tarassovi]MBE8413881.1 SDR family oxidoreductase [Leptospira borgpetersenii serovar Tarassovi]MBE8425782.1 SDR family oxidoreductase [Leptospira borgpetersenii serovar Tarassovi]
MTRKRILVTGSSGFLGGRIAKYFGTLNEFELILGTTKSFQLPNYIRSGKVILIDWNSQNSLESVCENVEYVIHCAGINAQDAAKDPQKAFEFNGHVTGRLMDAAIKNGSFKFIYISTAHVYGNPLIGNISENSPLTNQHPYAMSNLAGEREVSDRNALGGIFGINIRLSNAFGAPVDPNVNCWMLLVNELCKQAVITQKMVLRTSGVQRRNFISIQDVCLAVHHLLRIQSEHKDDIYNVGGGMSLTVWEMANLVRERCKQVLDFLPELERIEPEKNEVPADFNYDTTKLLSTGFRHSDTFTSEIDDLLIFCKLHFKG